MSPTPRRAAPARATLTALFAGLLLLSACGSDGSDDASGVATLGADAEAEAAADTTESGTTASDAAEAPENVEDAFALFDECMTELGFDLETSVGAAGGSIAIEGIGGSDTDPDPQSDGGGIADFDFEDFEAANDECGRHLANIDGGFDLTPEQEAAFEDAQLEWSKCMEDQGLDVGDFTSSGTGGGIVIESVEIDGEDPQSGTGFVDPDFDFEEFETAASECDHVFEELDAGFAEDDQ